MNAQTLVLTDNAANKVRQLRDSEGNQELMLRVYVTGGGCSGFSYGFNFAESMNEDDAEFINGDVKMLVDSLSYQYLQLICILEFLNLQVFGILHQFLLDQVPLFLLEPFLTLYLNR